MQRTNTLLSVSLAMLSLWGIGASRNAPKGAQVFKVYCAKCHSTGTQAGVAPGLGGILKSKRMSEQEVRTVIRDGRETMPPFGSKLAAAQMKDLIDFLKTI